MTRTQYKTLSFPDKKKAILEVIEKNRKKSEVAKEFGIPLNTLSTYLKNKDKIFDSALKYDTKRKRDRSGNNPELDKCVLKWFTKARSEKIPLSGPIIKVKAQEFGAKLNLNNFKASNGWLDNFKGREAVVCKKICGESASVNIEDANKWKNDTLLEIIKDYKPEDIFNVDETGLFFKCTPDRTLAFKNEKCFGGKLSKERLTLLVGANMSGTEKLPLYMIGKFANPPCFKNVKTKPLEYSANKKAWMTAELFSEWIIKLNKKFRCQKRKVLLFVDNCTAHKKDSIPPLSNIKVVYFPANMTSVLQPMDQGIIKNFKHFYRVLLVKNVLSDQFNKNKDNQIKVDVLQAARMCSTAWDQVTSKTVANCFKKAGYLHAEDKDEEIEETNENDKEQNVVEILDDPNNDWENFVNIDENLAICGELTDAEIVSEVVSQENECSDEENDPAINEKTTPTVSQVLKLIEDMRIFAESQENVGSEIFQALNKIEEFTNERRNNSLKQTKISSFFSKIKFDTNS